MTALPIPVQVMKIIMTLTVEEAGRVHYVKRPGALLEAGCVIAQLELDDPTKVKPVSLQDSRRSWLRRGAEQPLFGAEEGMCCCSGTAPHARAASPGGCAGAQVAAPQYGTT